MKYTQEYKYRRIASWFDRKARKLAERRVAREVVRNERSPFRKYQ